jgi:hypothetical protein
VNSRSHWFSTERGFALASREEVADRAERAARNQSLFREINERVRDLNERFDALTTLSDWICECASDVCFERIEMTARDYEHVRGEGHRFLVAPADEHVWRDVERIVERHPSYWIVEKIGMAGELAEESDPRSDEGPVSFRA